MVKRNELNNLCLLVKEAAVANDFVLKNSLFFEEMRNIESELGKLKAADILKKILSILIAENEPKIFQLNYPQTVLSLIKKEFDRIKKFIESTKNDYFCITKHPLRCDLRIALMSDN